MRRKRIGPHRMWPRRMAMHIFFYTKGHRISPANIYHPPRCRIPDGRRAATHRRDIAYADFGISAMRRVKLLERAVMRMLKNHFRSSVYLKCIFEAVAAARRIRVRAICSKVRDLKFTKKI